MRRSLEGLSQRRFSHPATAGAPASSFAPCGALRDEAPLGAGAAFLHACCWVGAGRLSADNRMIEGVSFAASAGYRRHPSVLYRVAHGSTEFGRWGMSWVSDKVASSLS